MSSIDAHIALVAKGQFLTILSEADVGFADGGIAIEALPINLSSHREVGIITLKNRTLTPAVQLFLDYVRELVRPPGGKSVRSARTHSRNVGLR